MVSARRLVARSPVSHRGLPPLFARRGHDEDDTPSRLHRQRDGPAGEDGLVVGMGVERHQAGLFVARDSHGTTSPRR
jgi:hypothetical protein